MKKVLKVIFGRAFYTSFSLLLQILLMIWATGLLAGNYFYFSLLLDILAILIALRITVKWDNIAYRLVWVFVILAVPVFGLSLFAMFGRTSINRKTKKHYIKVEGEYLNHLAEFESCLPPDDDLTGYVHRQMNYIDQYGAYPSYQNTDVKFYSPAEEALEDMFTALRGAKKFIFLEYFTIQNAKVWKTVEEILISKVKQGVEVRVIYDDFGSLKFIDKDFAKRMNRYGIQCRIFNPFIPFIYVFMNHRDHRKIMVIDNEISFTGGFNLADEYFNLESPYGHWKDSGIRLEGDAVRNHTLMFLEMWNFIKKTDLSVAHYLVPYAYEAKEKDTYVQPYSDTPIDHEPLGENVYMNIIKTAKHHVYITTPYLIISEEMNRELCMAAKRGVDVRIITPGIPDKKSIFLLTQSYYERLIHAGVRIYQYSPGFIHAKQYLCDDEIAVVGTINMDFRSLYLHFECATYLYHCEAIKDIRQDFENMFPICEEITLDLAKKHTGYKNFKQSVLRLLAPMF